MATDVCGKPLPTDVERTAHAVCAMLNGLPGPLDAELVEAVVHKTAEMRQAFGGPVVDESAVLKRVDTWLRFGLWDWGAE